MRQQPSGQCVRGAGVDRERGQQLLGGQGGQRSHRQWAQRAGVVHEQVETGLPLDLFHERVLVAGVGDVAEDADHPRPANRPPQRFGATAVDDDGPAAVGERVGEGAAEAGGPSGDECNRHLGLLDVGDVAVKCST